MNTIFINLSNHPLEGWSKSQLNAARTISPILVDLSFPAVPPTATTQEVRANALNLVTIVENIAKDNHAEDIHVMIQGEFTLVHNFVNAAKDVYIKCYAATSKRETTIDHENQKISRFTFVQLRQY